MPELPEVESACRELAPHVAGRRIVGIERLSHPPMVESPAIEAFEGAIVGRAIAGVRRRAKWILLGLDAGLTLAIHLRMTGDVSVVPAEAELDKHTHLSLMLDDGRRLVFRDPRKFGKLRLLDATGLAALEAAHGPEPLSAAFTPAVLAAALAGKGGRLKPLLLDQKRLAGVGNIYADEALFEAGVHPLRAPGSLSEEEVEALHRAIREVLERAIARTGPWRY
ncbi:MAG: DNA-formamidopyrimidine glycosylase, partial [Candidatus Sericytochromatia bacterium]